MAQIVKPIYTQDDIWGAEGDRAQPPIDKIKNGWGHEMMPAEYENWIQNRQDQAIAYLYQFGVPEWDSLTEYIANKSFVQFDGNLYLARITNIGTPPSTSGAGLTNWLQISENAQGTAKWTVANMAALNTLSVTTRDVHKIAYVKDIDSYYSLITHSPKRWKLIVPQIVYAGDVGSEIQSLSAQISDLQTRIDTLRSTISERLATMKTVSTQMPSGIPLDGQEWIVI